MGVVVMEDDDDDEVDDVDADTDLLSPCLPSLQVLTLVTNSLKLDLNNPNPFVVGLALSAVGNLATEDIARDLAMDVDKVRDTTVSHRLSSAIGYIGCRPLAVPRGVGVCVGVQGAMASPSPLPFGC
jgi:hypothetical protein